MIKLYTDPRRITIFILFYCQSLTLRTFFCNERGKGLRWHSGGVFWFVWVFMVLLWLFIVNTLCRVVTITFQDLYNFITYVSS